MGNNTGQKPPMDRAAILAAIEGLSKSQGFYGRLLANLRELEADNPDKYNMVMADFEAQQFEDVVDLVIYLEE